MIHFSLVYIIGTYPGLTTTFIDREIRALRQKGVTVRVISIRRPHTILSKDQEALQRITSYLLPVSWGKFLAAHLRFAFQKPEVYFGVLIKLLASPHPSLAARLMTVLHFAEGVYAAGLISKGPVCEHIHAHFVDRASTVALVAGKLLELPYSVTAHANDIYINPVLLPLKLKQASFVATCTDYNRQYLAELVPLNGSLHCLHHGLDLASYEPITVSRTGQLMITSVGQLKEKKGFCYLLEACRILKSEGYEFKCQIIGEGSLREALEAQIRDLSLEEVVSLRGALPHEDVIREYQHSTLFVLPAVTAADGDRDGIPNVILEAMAMRLPVVSTNHSGIPEAIEDGWSGLLVPPADPDALVEAIARLLKDPQFRRRLGRNARDTVAERFDVRRNADLLLGEMVKS